jgi:hypothetical protein
MYKWRPVFEHPHLHVSVKLEALRTICYLLSAICYLLPVVTYGMEVWAPPVLRQRGRIDASSPAFDSVSKTLRPCSATVCTPSVASAAVVGLGKIVRPPLSCAGTRPFCPGLLRMTWHTSGC